MRTIRLTTTGSFRNTYKLLSNIRGEKYYEGLIPYAEEGVRALSRATPKDTGLTANSWSYKIVKEDGRLKIIWTNSNVVSGVPIAIILQYGHATRNGGWVEGIDYINPALKPIFEKIRDKVWKEVTK